MKLQSPQLPQPPSSNDRFGASLIEALTRILRLVINQLNEVSDGSISAITNATTSAPTGGTYSQGDFVRNSAPQPLGVAGSLYIITGWICIESGSPGVWGECRVLTGG